MDCETPCLPPLAFKDLIGIVKMGNTVREHIEHLVAAKLEGQELGEDKHIIEIDEWLNNSLDEWCKKGRDMKNIQNPTWAPLDSMLFEIVMKAEKEFRTTNK